MRRGEGEGWKKPMHNCWYRSLTSNKEWEIEEAEPLHTQQQLITEKEKEVCGSLTSNKEWEIEEAEPLHTQQQLITEKEKEVSMWVKQNTQKLGKLLGADLGVQIREGTS
ncbi:hypothetical protein H5410_004879 [Solanum commersonii]|uniref:Uncharacterized protein n=1 Tax=Solanum commersonii TaxID=4109 RepID=A0A9J6A524_SOLCO|nr:hypothetical protein H5410_004879 [Solanum commersonii]